MKTITLAEPPFLSIQGEGVRIGRPTVFIRTYVCNLRCAHCDSKNSWGTGKFGDKQFSYSVEELKEEVRKFFPVREICLTGGEPMLEGNGVFLKSFIWEMHNVGYEFTIETAATIYNTKIIKSPVNLWSISPKYPCRMTGYVDWVNKAVLNAMIHKLKPEKIEFKLLISNETDIVNAKELIKELEPRVYNKLVSHRIPIIVQPDCEANWTKESYKPELDSQFKTTAKEIPTTEGYLKEMALVIRKVSEDPVLRQLNLTFLPQLHKLIGVV